MIAVVVYAGGLLLAWLQSTVQGLGIGRQVVVFALSVIVPGALSPPAFWVATHAPVAVVQLAFVVVWLVVVAALLLASRPERSALCDPLSYFRAGAGTRPTRLRAASTSSFPCRVAASGASQHRLDVRPADDDVAHLRNSEGRALNATPAKPTTEDTRHGYALRE